MKREFLVFCLVVGGAVIHGCSSAPQKQTQQHASQSEQPPGRAVAADWDDEEFEATYNNFMKSEDTSRLYGFIRRNSGLYFRIHNALKEYDEKLDDLYENAPESPGVMLRSREYATMIALRILNDRQIERVSGVYGTMLEKLMDPSTSRTEKDKIRRSLRFLRQKIQQASPADRIALASFGQENEAVRKSMTSNKLYAKLSRQDKREFFAENFWQRILFKQPGSLAAFIELNHQSLEEVSKATEDQAPLTSLNKVVESIHAELQMVFPEREIQQELKIYPDAGPNGNITGRTFPLNTWAITYDDGPHPSRTSEIVETFKSYNAKATFFWLAENIKKFVGTVNKVQTVGMPIESHSYTHANIPTLSAAAQRHEMHDAFELTNTYLQTPIRFFRLPYGSGVNVPSIRQQIAAENLVHVFWNVDTLDWQDKSPASIMERVKKQMALEKKGIILFHDIHQQSVDTAKLLLAYIQNNNQTNPVNAIRLVTIPEIVDEINGVIK